MIVFIDPRVGGQEEDSAATEPEWDSRERDYLFYEGASSQGRGGAEDQKQTPDKCSGESAK